METGVLSLKDAVALDVENYLENHFEKIVLKPEISDPVLQDNYIQNLKQAQNLFLSVMAEFDSEFQKFVAKKTNLLENLDESRIVMVIDWHRQFQKVSMAGYEKGGAGALLGAGLVIGGGVAGKAIAVKMGKGTAVKLLASGSFKSLMAKLSTPFVSKGVAVASSAATGGAAGTCFGGPLGAVAGACTGILIDYAINEGVELMNRGQFEKDTRLVIHSFQSEFEARVTKNLDAAVDIWFDDLINLLANFK